MTSRLQDKTLLITGSTGIAAATARLAAAEGAQVFITSRTEANCAALAAALGEPATYHAANLTHEAAADTIVAACLQRFGRIDALFNVAGISGRRFGDGPVHECTSDGWDVTLNANLKSMFFMCRAVVGHMLKQDPSRKGERGTVLNMASVLGFSPQRDFFSTHAYATSKGGILSLSKSMAAYYAPHKIRVNAIAPALVRTPMSARAQDNPDILALMKTKQPLHEDLINAEDVASAALFLLSDEARSITGDVLTVDGGWCVSG